MIITPKIIRSIAITKAGKDAALIYLPHLNKYMERFEISTPIRAAYFLAQVAHESQDFTRVEENLNYSADGLAKTWPTRFRDAASGQPNALARKIARKPQEIANHAYAGRMGNSDAASGEGWRFRGKGLIQLTGKINHALAGKALGVDLINNPAMLLLPEWAAASACWFWHSNGLNQIADRGDFEAVTRKVNGGTHGHNERVAYLSRAMDVMEFQAT